MVNKCRYPAASLKIMNAITKLLTGILLFNFAICFAKSDDLDVTSLQQANAQPNLWQHDPSGIAFALVLTEYTSKHNDKKCSIRIYIKNNSNSSKAINPFESIKLLTIDRKGNENFLHTYDNYNGLSAMLIPIPPGRSYQRILESVSPDKLSWSENCKMICKFTIRDQASGTNYNIESFPRQLAKIIISSK